jgi:IclR family acetate operon transcriptional repressor
MAIGAEMLGGAYPIKAVDRVCDILDILANNPEGVSLPEIAAAAELPKSSAFRYLVALEARRYVERDATHSTYRLGLAFRHQDSRAMDQLIESAVPELEKLRDMLGETTNLAVLDGPQVVHTLVVESPHMMRLAARPGERAYIHSTALGKALCAELPEGRVRSMLSVAGMPRFTRNTITDPDRYIEELARVRRDGFGMDDAENQLNGRCVAVAIEGLSFHAGISVSAPADRFPTEDVPAVVRRMRRIAKLLAKTAAG